MRSSNEDNFENNRCRLYKLNDYLQVKQKLKYCFERGSKRLSEGNAATDNLKIR